MVSLRHFVVVVHDGHAMPIAITSFYKTLTEIFLEI